MLTSLLVALTDCATISVFEVSSTAELIANWVCLMVARRLSRRNRDCNKRKSDSSVEPPPVPGCPILGNGPQFQSNAVEFLLNCRQKFGDLFSIAFPGGHRIHILMDPHSVGEFGRTKSLDFGPIHEQVTRNVFGFNMPDSHRMLRDAARTARAGLRDDIGRYATFLDEGLDAKEAETATKWRREMLDNFLSETQLRAIFNCIFGRSDNTPFNHANARRLFADIQASFNYVWLGFPVWLFPRTWLAWRQIRKAHPSPEELINRPDCSSYIRSVMRTMLNSDESRASMLGHNLVYLHVNYNTKKATYWAIRNLLSDANALQAVRQEIDSAIDDRIHSGRGGEDETELRLAEFTAEEIDRLPLLDSLVNETFRLASGVFMIRQVTEDIDIRLVDSGAKFRLKRGDKAAIYPPALHRDPLVFQQPNSFKIDRFVDSEFEFRGRQLTRPILPYGVLCPGQKLSMAQIKWFIFALVARFELLADGTLAEYDFSSYGHEILPPIEDMSFLYRPRSGRPRVRLILA